MFYNSPFFAYHFKILYDYNLINILIIMHTWMGKGDKYTQTGWLVKTLNHEKSQQATYRGVLQKGVQNFIQTQGTQQRKIQLFKNLLKHEIDKANTQINNKPIYQLWQSFGFLFTADKIPIAIKIFIFYSSQNMKPSSYTKTDIDFIDKQVVNEAVSKALFDSVAYGAPHIQNALVYYDITSVSASGTGVWGKIFSQIKEYFMDSTAKLSFLKTLNKLRTYGQFIIDCNYIEVNGVTSQIQGQILYQLMSLPLAFRFVSGTIMIYLKVGSKVTYIAPAQFNKKFLQGILKGQLAQRTSNVITAFNAYMSPQSAQQVRKKQFINTYITPGKKN